jgi:hypothetical protein
VLKQALECGQAFCPSTLSEEQKIIIGMTFFAMFYDRTLEEHLCDLAEWSNRSLN